LTILYAVCYLLLAEVQPYPSISLYSFKQTLTDRNDTHQ